MTPLHPSSGRDVGWLVDEFAHRSPDRPFLTWVPFDADEQRWSRGEFAHDVAALVAGLSAQGVRPQDRVALVMPNCPDFLLAWCAVVSLGAVAVCLNPRSARDELAYVAEHSGISAAIVAKDRVADVRQAMPGLVVIVTSDPLLGRGSLDGLLKSVPATQREVCPSLDAASIQYTSGTTARPKAVVWTQANCLWAGRVGASHQGLGAEDINLVHLPLFHTNALSYSFLATLWAGGQIVLQPKFSASRFWDVSVRYGATWTSVVSFCLRALDGRPVPEGHAYRGWGNSYNIGPSTAVGGIPVIGWFGMTETVSHPIVGDLWHDDVDGTIGRPAGEYEIQVVDLLGAPVIPGQIGELLIRGVRGVSLFAEYLNDAAATSAAFTDDGWFRTGDRIRVELTGALTFVEREKDVLKVGGENIGAPEIERVLLGMEGVREAAVVGRPDTMLGEVPVAFVTLETDVEVEVEAMAAWCTEMLTDFKRPREIRVVDQLPRSTLDKVSKAALRASLAQGTTDG